MKAPTHSAASKTSTWPELPFMSEPMRQMILRSRDNIEKRKSWSKARWHKHLIAIGALKPNGDLNWPKIDHVPMGPRE